MAVTYHIPAPLREYTDGARRVALEARPATAGEALALLWERHPDVRDRVLNERGDLRAHVNVFVGDESIRFTGGMDTPVKDGDEISILPAVSGG